MRTVDRRRSERGFVLVGVVIIVLALTILGLSLFSLSNYEAQFMQRSLDRQQALQSALGGLDRARYALITKNELPKVKAGLPLENVFYTRATQFNGAVMDSAGVVDWGGNDVHIESAATVDGVTRWAEGWYVPHQSYNWYSRLMTLASVSATVQVDILSDGGRVHPNLSDSAWVAGSGNVWLLNVVGLATGNVKFGVPVPVPNASGFIAAHSTAPDIGPASANLMFLAPQGGAPAYWYTDRPKATAYNFSYYDVDHGVALNHEIHVTGRAVWCLPRGVRFDKRVQVVSDGDPNACLVIVAGQGDDGTSPPPPPPLPFDDFAGIWFFSGLVSDQVPVILVSNSTVKIESQQDQGAISDVAHLSIFANQVWFKGPTTGTVGAYMSLAYGDRTTMKAQLDFLFSYGALPNSSSPSSTQLSLRPGTWHVTQ